MTMSEFNDMLLQHFDEAILRGDEKQIIIPINNRFQIHNDFLEVTHEQVFDHHPFAPDGTVCHPRSESGDQGSSSNNHSTGQKQSP